MAAYWGELYKHRDHGNTFVVALCYAGRTPDDFKQESGPNGRKLWPYPWVGRKSFLSKYSLSLWCHYYYFSAPD